MPLVSWLNCAVHTDGGLTYEAHELAFYCVVGAELQSQSFLDLLAFLIDELHNFEIERDLVNILLLLRLSALRAAVNVEG